MKWDWIISSWVNLPPPCPEGEAQRIKLSAGTEQNQHPEHSLPIRRTNHRAAFR